ncbi:MULTISPECIES: hypothetical protein [unclassified Corallococcus]|uniref:hypothetical protein n=1 Tax=unclassified Corallococcus TaxID=2685029 RepID=UPI001A8FE279|nr:MULTISPECIES: hypothetical protein [unclassified Corallococcus]MBN9683059.1 hypothetical protein [Corallococcus sp. NCSPR001]WAS85408.1 hypothetical protein O0N60_00195 [Corallococcus sp. NCRR]
MRILWMLGGMVLGSALTLIAGVALWLHDTGPARAGIEVRVENRTGQAVREVRIEHDHGQVLYRAMGKGDTVALTYPVRGESSYRLIAVLEDGRELKGGAGYIERGARTREVLEPERVVSSDP